MKEIQGKPIKGYSYADGIHWYWGDEEVAVISQYTSEIEWCNRKFHFPEEVIQHIRDLRPRAAGTWVIEVKRISHSVTQGSIDVRINGKSVITFGDDKEMIDGEWKSKTSDEDLGKYVYALLYHPLDHIYHYSDKVKDIFKPNWRKEN